MLNFHFSLYWPFENSFSRPKDYFIRDWKISKNKSLEIQVSRVGDDIFTIGVRYTLSGDHAGLSIQLGLLRHNLMLEIYDHRHWDYDHGCWIEDSKRTYR